MNDLDTLSTADFAELSNLTDSRLRQLARAGKLPSPVKGAWPAKRAIQALLSYYQTNCDQADTLSLARKKLIEKQTELAALKVGVMEKKYVEAAAVDHAWHWVAESIRAIIMHAERLTDAERRAVLKNLSDIDVSQYERTIEHETIYANPNPHPPANTEPQPKAATPASEDHATPPRP